MYNYKIIIDSHKDEFHHPIENIHGWVMHPAYLGSNLKLVVNNVDLQACFFSRDDIDKKYGIGFSCYLDLVSVFQGELPNNITLNVLRNTQIVDNVSFAINKCVESQCKEIIKSIPRKKIFLSKHASRLEEIPGCNAKSALPRNWSLSPRKVDKQDIPSAHAYNDFIIKLVDKYTEGGGFVLDAGAGLRRLPHKNVINTEIYDYPSTDVLAIGQDLPFDDNCFEGVLSLAVLEHVDDPFKVASELQRVVKPGGFIYILVPFLQAEHGYPSHYFNSTRFGVKKLFENCFCESQWLNRSDNPIFTIHQILSLYKDALPKQTRDIFSRTTVDELIKIGSDAHRNIDHEFMLLDAEKSWQIAWGTSSLFKKV